MKDEEGVAVGGEEEGMRRGMGNTTSAFYHDPAMIACMKYEAYIMQQFVNICNIPTVTPRQS